MDLVILFAIAWALAHAWDHARAARAESRGQHVKKAEQKAGAPLSPVQRKSVKAQHDIGWWSSEILHGAPVHRTGFHAGWLANKAAAVQAAHRREEARNLHADLRESFGQRLRERKEAVRQAGPNVVPLPVRKAEPVSQPAAHPVSTPVAVPKPAPVMGPFVPQVVSPNSTATDVRPDPLPDEGKDMPAITVPAERTYDQSIRKANEIIARCDVELVRLRAQQIGQMVEELAAAAVDGTSLGHLADVDDATRRQIQAVQDQHDSAQAFKSNLIATHSQGAEYHHAAPGGGAEKSFLQE